ncbi:MAG TPA: heme exporter protein CcmD [Rhizomicrobium sp.]|nr:heme exporter protein CcmD [Rhizomicrobium sp.]
MNSFFAMGGYAAFVWPAYAVTALGLGGAAALAWFFHARAMARLAALEREE